MLPRLVMIAVASLCLFAGPAQGDIYKYRDADGKWRFSDTPPAQGNASQIESSKVAAVDAKRNHALRLEKKYQPANVAEHASLAVVKVETPLGSGSGFFISRSGLLVTNRHVVRPPNLSDADVQGKYERAEQNLARARDSLQRQRARLESARLELEEYKRWYRDLSKSEQSAQRDAFQARKKQYRQAKRDVEKFARRVGSESEKLNSLKRDYNRKHANTSVARQFRVYLKDDTPLQAQLVAIAPDTDLALLQVENAVLPALKLRQPPARQGEKIFAIGSPLGNSDYVTAGIVTSLKREQIIVDAQIHPGNSGGPLLDAGGEVLGINTWKWLPAMAGSGEGFGIAIPAAVIAEKFSVQIERDRASRQVPGGESSQEPDAALRDAIMREFREGK